MNPLAYTQAWTRTEDLESLNKRIHDGYPLEQLLDRGRAYRDTLFESLFAYAKPGLGAKVLELGGGVGWIIQAMLEKFPIAEIVDLDISENMLTRAQERWRDNRARFVLYNGFDFPFPDSYFDTVYSVATLQHIDKNVAFLIFRELYRVLAPRGHGVLHVLSVRHIPHSVTPYDVECWNHIRNNANEHWHHYYSLEELFVLFSELIQVDELDIRYLDEALWIHFSKATGRKFMSEKLPLLAGMGKYASAVEYPGLLDSRSYKIGRAITYPWRCVLELLKRHVK